MTGSDSKPPQNKSEHQRRAAEALRENLRRRKEQQRKQIKPVADSDDGAA